MSAAELRKAAETLRERAEGATSGEWIPYGTSIGVTVKGCTCAGTAPGYPQHESYCGTDGPVIDATEPDIAYIATVQPGVGLALADVLERAAFEAEGAEHTAHAAANLSMTGVDPAYPPLVRDLLDLARLINGEVL